MQSLINTILSYNGSVIEFETRAGTCACCGQPVTLAEETLVNEFWLEMCSNPNPHIFIDLIVYCEELSPDQYNSFHEPLLCMNCLRWSVHQDTIGDL